MANEFIKRVQGKTPNWRIRDETRTPPFSGRHSGDRNGFDATGFVGQEITITVKKGDKKVDEKAPFDGHRPSVDVAILLDTSNSMDGLISQAKTQLWKIVQQFAAAEKAGKTPQLRVSVFEYGNSGLPASEDYIRQVVGLTDDLDKVSEALFSLSTNGGDEYCGAVINEALTRLDWSKEPNAYKAIFIAGNEPFTQGQVDYQKSCKRSIEEGVVVNTIHCGDYNRGVSGKWQHGAQLAEGEYMNINQDRKVVHIKCPQDEIIIRLNRELNGTYLWYGAENQRKAWSSNQIAQDENALQAGGGGGFAGGRIQSKISGVYNNRGRDLVDTLQQDKKILSKLKDTELPEAMQGMSAVERQAHIEKMAARRNEIKKQIAALNVKREAYKAEQMKQNPEMYDDTLGDVISKAVRQQMKKSGFDFKKN